MSEEDRIVLVIDDGGFVWENPDQTGYRIPFGAYERLLRLARTHEVAIPIAVTAGFIDIHNISGLNLASVDAGRLVDFLKQNERHFPIWSHGLSHRTGDTFTEFHLYEGSISVSPDAQARGLELSRAIFDAVGLTPPTVLVPPGHCWQPGVTDKLAKRAGFETIAIREFEKTPLRKWLINPRQPFKQTWNDSHYLKTIYRLGLGLVYNKRRLTGWDFWKTKRYVEASDILTRTLLHRKKNLKRPHHFFAHIHNFSREDSGRYWDSVMAVLLRYYQLDGNR